MAIRFIRIDGAYTPTRGKRAFSADGEINGQPHHFETRADNVIEALEVCERAIARGEIDPAVDIEVALDMLFGFTIYHLISDDLSKKSNHIKQVVEFFYRGMSASAGRRPQR